MNYKRIKNNVWGNPRIVVHFLALLTEKENEQLNKQFSSLHFISAKYNFALNKAKAIGGKKFHNKQFGGGIVFTVDTIEELQERIDKLNKECNK